MKKKRDYLRIVTTIAEITVFIFVMVTVFLVDDSSISLKVTPSMDVSSDWTNMDTDQIERRSTIEVLPGGSLKLSRTLPNNLNDDKVLGYYDYGFRVIAFVDSEQIYSFGGDSYGKFGTELGQAWRSIALKEDYSGKTLIVIFENDTDTTMRINLSKMQITYASSEVVRSFTSSKWVIIVIIIFVLLWAILLVFSIALWRAKFKDSFHSMILLSSLSLTLGIWSWANSSMCQLMFYNQTYGYKMAYLVYPLVALFLGLFYQRIYKDYEHIFNLLNATYRISLVLIYSFYMTNLVPISQSEFVAHVYLFSFLIIGNVLGVRNYIKERNHVNHWTMIGQLILMLVSIIFIPLYYLQGQENSFLYGEFAFVVFLLCMTLSQGIYFVKDLTELRRDMEFKERTRFNPVTGGNSRMGFIYHLEELDFKGIDAPWFVLMELTNFASVNELFSWKNSGRMLKGIYEANETLLEEGDFQATVGEGAFGFLLPARKNIEELCDGLSKGLQKYMEEEWSDAFLLPRFGVTRVNPGDDLSKLLACAHLAYVGRDKEKVMDAGINFYDFECSDRILKGQVLEDALNRSLVKEKVEMTFTPVVQADTGQVIQAYTRLVWNTKAESDLFESNQIPQNEKDALEVRMNQRHLELIFKYFSEHRGQENIRLAAHISKGCLINQKFWNEIWEAKEKYEADFSKIDLEFSLNNVKYLAPELKNIISVLHGQGASVSVTGFDGSRGMLQLIKDLQVDWVVILSELLADVGGEAVIRELHEQDLKICIYGVSGQEEEKRLKELGVERMSGDYFTKLLGEGENAAYEQ